MFDHDSNGMQYLVTTMGSDTYFTAYHVPQHQSCASTRSILESACLARPEGGLYVDIDIWLHSHRIWPQYMRGTAGIACHMGLRNYAHATRTGNDGTPTDDTDDDLPMWENKGCFAIEPLFGAVTTECMGVAKGYPKWDVLRDELTRRVIHIFRVQEIPRGHWTMYVRDMLIYHGYILPTSCINDGVKDKSPLSKDNLKLEWRFDHTDTEWMQYLKETARVPTNVIPQ